MNEGDFSKRDAFVLLDADYPIIMDTNQCLGYFSKFPRPLTTNAKGLYKTGLSLFLTLHVWCAQKAQGLLDIMFQHISICL